jgi:hypothetical protein
MEFKNEQELIEWVYTMHLQNTNGRETHNEMFKQGIEAAINELKQLKLLDLHIVMKSVCQYCKEQTKPIYDDELKADICPKCHA